MKSSLKLTIRWQNSKWLQVYPANIYLFKINNRNTRKRCFCQLSIYFTPSLVFIIDFEQLNVNWVQIFANFDQMQCTVLVFLLLANGRYLFKVKNKFSLTISISQSVFITFQIHAAKISKPRLQNPKKLRLPLYNNN